MYIPVIETQPYEYIKKFQEKELSKLLYYLNTKSLFYKRLFLNNNIDVNKIKKLEDLRFIPTTKKEELQEYTQDFICIEKTGIIDYITTSGTMGNPVTFVMNDSDLERLAYNEYISFSAASCTNNDVFQLMTTIDRRFMAGLAYFLGIRKLGAGIVRVGNGIPELQWDTIQRIKPNVIVAVPSFILKIIEYAEQNNIDYKNTSIKKAICIGDPLRNQDFTLNTLGKRITEKWDIKLYSTYASTEMAVSFTECDYGVGGHHHPELLIVEILDDDDNPVKNGDIGEITITTLGVQSMPLLRFKTGDISRIHTQPCNCGRTTLRLGPVIGRKKQMIKYKGTTLYPNALNDILDNIEGIKNYIVEVFTNDIGTDEIIIRIGIDKKIPQEFEKIIKDHFRAKLRVAPQISFESKELINSLQYPVLSRKPIKFVDKRNNNL